LIDSLTDPVKADWRSPRTPLQRPAVPAAIQLLVSTDIVLAALVPPCASIATTAVAKQPGRR
jgi:hypothetical protein